MNGTNSTGRRQRWDEKGRDYTEKEHEKQDEKSRLPSAHLHETAMLIAVSRLSPVIIHTLIPASNSDTIVCLQGAAR